MKKKEYKFDFDTHSQFPTIQFKDRIFTVRCSKENVMNMRKGLEKVADEDKDKYLVESMIGKEGADYVYAQDMPLSGIVAFVEMINAAIEGVSVEEIQEAMAGRKGNFPK